VQPRARDHEISLSVWEGITYDSFYVVTWKA
jgi:hypothetical protein